MKVVAALACRVQSKRLYAKPLQFIDIDQEISILEYLVNFLKTCKGIDEIILAISEGQENKPFEQLAEKMKIPYIIGSEEDVQGRLITAAEKVQGDIIYRVTTECPFIYMETFQETLELHIKNKAAITIIEELPEGVYYELINFKDIKQAHQEGEERHRSELCTLYMSENPEKFFIQKLKPKDEQLKRPDIRLTVDYPEDLIVVREVYKYFKDQNKEITVNEIIKYLDNNIKLKEVNGWIDAGQGRIWN